MKSLWNESEAALLGGDLLKLRVYTSRLLGQDSALVLHGGGNTSVKATVKNLFDESEDVLYVKGSGWDLGTIEAAGFAPVKMDVLLKMAKMAQLSDTDMVNGQRAAMLNPNAPNPSVEAILHAIIPFKFVDHTHADSVVAITNSKNGEARIKEVYGNRVLYVPYVMPGFILAKTVYDLTRTTDWTKYDGMVLLHHGIFTFDNDARRSYEKMIELVTLAEDYIKKNNALPDTGDDKPVFDWPGLAKIRKEVSTLQGRPVVATLNSTSAAVHFTKLKGIEGIANRGPLTPDHVIRTKRVPVVLTGKPGDKLSRYAAEYRGYFDRNTDGKLTCLDLAPRWAVWPEHGLIHFGISISEARIIQDIIEHTIQAVQSAEKLGGWQALSEKDLFEVEYWELEQAKLKKSGKPNALQGKIALVTGAASGIGRACVEALQSQGACVAALDINPEIKTIYKKKDILPVVCDVTNVTALKNAVNETVKTFGGLDILVSNAGMFPPSTRIESMTDELWQKSIELNLTSHQRLLTVCAPFLALGIDPAIVIIASKNVPAPGPGAAAYSVAKAGLTQLARVAALEMGPAGVRVNVVHPNQVFDTAIWTKDILEARAKQYKMSVEEYKTSNILKTEITSKHVAELVAAMAGPIFAKTTGAQIPIDGGNERVI